MTGTVVEWDESAGIGTVAAGDQGDRYFFHCTQIADGTRTTEVGQTVSFAIRPGHLGRYEAYDLRKAPSP